MARVDDLSDAKAFLCAVGCSPAVDWQVRLLVEAAKMREPSGNKLCKRPVNGPHTVSYAP